ncbi:MAG: transcriptional regulator NrdR [Candidatus Micrarchaeota archaeon]|nr:transcriptional regulator NrdR [Candidatus Micrarchaeota archaeon]MDE1847910.1 transcriptional regulator NrdR [Candidatus Micrarchaeota archaeon]MDE1864536.1 transcriptional regulator NrdR [Candidatus Micrarchaeota archaeon]
MRCPFCLSSNIRVLDSRDVEEENSVRRRRLCNSCSKRFTTYEKAELVDLVVIKKDGTRQPYDKDKILGGMLKACEKRPVNRNDIEDLANKIDRKIRAKGVKEITTRRIGEMVIKELVKLDAVAYVRFASVYNQFNSTTEFTRIIGMFNKRREQMEQHE